MQVNGAAAEQDRPSSDPFRLALGGLVALTAGIGIGRFAYTPILPTMIRALGLNASEAGMIASANFLGYLAGAIAASSSHIRGSRRTWLLTALAMNSAAMIVMGSTTALAHQLALRFVGGAASAFILVFASSLVLDSPTVAGKHGFSHVHFAGVGFGIIISAASVAILTHAGANWELLWLVNGAMCFVAFVAVAILIPDNRGAPAPSTLKLSVGLPAKLRFLIAAYGLFGFGYVITATFLIEIVRRSQEVASLEA
jgi:MFS family permease